jgi:phosphatidate cytidylyltransferase
MRTFLVRASTAVVFAAVVIGGLLFHPWAFFALMLIILLGSIFEFFSISRPMFKKDKAKLNFYRIMVASMSVLALIVSFLIAFDYIHNQFVFAIPLVFSAIFYTELVLRSKKPFRNIGLNLLALYYIALPLCLTFFIANMGGNFTGSILLGVLFIIWANDSGAYIVGSLIGKNKLIPHVSPNKTIEGFLGGGVFCFLVAYLNNQVFHTIPGFEALSLVKPTVWYIIAGVVFVFATMGDLVESLLKRSLEIKDSGNILPGHGGFLDRFDAFLFVLPFIVAVIKIFN